MSLDAFSPPAHLPLCAATVSRDGASCPMGMCNLTLFPVLTSVVQVEVNLAKEAEEDHFVMVPYCSSLDFFLTPSRVIRSHKSVCSTISTGTSATRDSFDLKVRA